MYDALTNGRWISDIQVALTLDVQVEYLTLLDLLSNVELLSCSLMLKIHTFGSSPPLGSIQLNLLMKLYLLGPQF